MNRQHAEPIAECKNHLISERGAIRDAARQMQKGPSRSLGITSWAGRRAFRYGRKGALRGILGAGGEPGFVPGGVAGASAANCLADAAAPFTELVLSARLFAFTADLSEFRHWKVSLSGVCKQGAGAGSSAGTYEEWAGRGEITHNEPGQDAGTDRKRART